MPKSDSWPFPLQPGTKVLITGVLTADGQAALLAGVVKEYSTPRSVTVKPGYNARSRGGYTVSVGANHAAWFPSSRVRPVNVKDPEGLEEWLQAVEMGAVLPAPKETP